MLMMSGVRAFEYIIGIMVIVMMFLVFGMVIFDQTGATKNSDTFEAVIVNMIAFILSMMIGFIIGVISDNQVSVGAVSLPVTLIIFLCLLWECLMRNMNSSENICIVVYFLKF